MEADMATRQETTVSIDISAISEAVLLAVEKALSQNANCSGGTAPPPPPAHGGDIIFKVSFYVGNRKESIVATDTAVEP
jgi:hypothetical protein